MKNIIIKGARIHNLKKIDIEIPKNKLTVITGVSGSGKSSLAFDTLFEEGKRRYLMFSGSSFMVDNEPGFDSITGLSPTVAVEQRITRQANPRSTVGTRTKIEAMLAALFAAYGTRHPDYNDSTPLTMEMFQRNSPKGMCVKCLGAGSVYTVDEGLLFADKKRTLITLLDDSKTHYYRRIHEFCKYHNLSPDQTIESLSEEDFFKFKYGDGGKTRFSGIIPWLIGFYKWSVGKHNWGSELKCVKLNSCPKCGGSGLNPYAAKTTVMGKTIFELEDMYIRDLCGFFKGYTANGSKLAEEILTKLLCLDEVGLHHVALSRQIPTLSGGEIQRLFLASYIIAEMDSIIFIFDEPTIGLHEVEKQKLIDIIKNLIDRGNTVVAVEHDENFMHAADYIIDIGPHAGVFGGERIFQGSYNDFLTCSASLTAPYLASTRDMPVKTEYKKVNKDKTLKLENCNIHNLRNVSANIPLGMLVGVAGVSGSGKSSLVTDTLVPKLKEKLKAKFISDNREEIGELSVDTVISGTEHIGKCIIVDQKPIGRSRTSCPATYTGIFDKVRKLFALESGLDIGFFTVNSKGGCKTCKGDGVIHYHVGFGNFMELDCEECCGTGFVEEAMAVSVDGKNIRDILSMSVSEAAVFFEGKDKTVVKMLKTLDRVGMGYIGLGQKTPTISGGEAQRIKLAKELGKSGSNKNNVYILDEPTTGLSFSDAEKLIYLLKELVDGGNTVIVTEHDPYVLSNCDYIIEMGPGGGSDGGYVIATGTPKDLKENNASVIGRYLKC